MSQGSVATILRWGRQN